MKFIADAMLGRLAKWLRLMGFDVLYYPDIRDRELIRVAREQERTILTRDTGLMKSRGVIDAVFVEADDLSAQLMQIREKLDFSAAAPLGRCEICNGSLSGVTGKEEIRDLVPDFVYRNYDHFVQCTGCGKVYWEGSHYREIREKIGTIMHSPPGEDRDEGRN
jgi:uncharacterized protein with PIN domain